MKKDDNPKKLFLKIAEIKQKHVDKVIDEDEIVAAIIAKVPREYKKAISQLARSKINVGDKVTVKMVEEELKVHYRIISGDDEDNNDDDDEDKRKMMLSAFSFKCFKCNKKGHKQTECKDENPEN